MVKKSRSIKKKAETVQEAWLGKTEPKKAEKVLVLKEFSCLFD